MKLKDLITDSNLELYKRVSNHLPIQLKKSEDELWGSNIEEKRIIITHSDTIRPQACFTHELLHVDTQLNGYRRLRSGLSLNNAVHQQLPFLCPAIDNEFQHHKMYPRFIGLGYAPNEFYHEADAVTEQYIVNSVNAKGQSLTSITSAYFTLIAPGRSISPDRIQELKAQFRAYDEGAFAARFDSMDEIIRAWKHDSSYDAEPYVKDLLNTLGCTDSWIAYVFDADHFPSDGFFNGDPFSMEDINKAFARTN